MNDDFEQIFWFWPLRGLKGNRAMCREGSRTGHWSFCPSSGTKLAIKNSLCFQFTSSRVPLTTAQDSHTAPLPLFPSVSRSLIPLWQTFPPLFCLRDAYNQHVPHVLDKSRGSVSAGAGWQYQPCNPLFIPPCVPHLPCAPPPPLLSQYWVAGVKGGQRNLITVTVGLFWHCSWSCADTHRAVCSL